MSGDENLWYVKTADGDVHRVTLDQLDEAFQAGRIEETVMVLAPGATKWAKLGELAGLDEPAKPAPVTPFAAVVPNSLRPVSMDLSLDLDDNAFKKKSRKGVVVGTVIGILAIFGGILFANRAHLGSGDSSAVAAAAAPAPPPVTAAAPPPAPPPAPAATTPPPAETASAASKLNDDQRAKLAAADKALEAKSKARKKNRATSAPPSSRKYKAQGFTTGGNKFDPLNASM
jgi:hypothetical protein